MISQVDFTAHIAEPTENRGLTRPSPNITFSNDHLQYHVTTSYRNSLFLARPSSGPVKKLTFLHIGSEEAANVSPYSGTCTSIEFSGHVASTNAVFAVLEQLKGLESVAILIGPLQGQYFAEGYKKPSQCPSVKTLKIALDKDYFHSLEHSDCDQCSTSDSDSDASDSMSCKQNFLIHLAQSLLIRAVDTFPNLRNLVVELPKFVTLCNIGQSLIQSCPRLRKKKEAEAQQVSNAAEKKQVYRMTFKTGGSQEAGCPPIDGGEDVPQQTSPLPGFRCLPRLAKHELISANVNDATINEQGLAQLIKLHPQEYMDQQVSSWLDGLKM